MNLDLNEEQKLIQDTARDFAVAELQPVAAELTRRGPAGFYENLRKLASWDSWGSMSGMNTAARGRCHRLQRGHDRNRRPAPQQP
jgi:hypothetical protein